MLTQSRLVSGSHGSHLNTDAFNQQVIIMGFGVDLTTMRIARIIWKIRPMNVTPNALINVSDYDTPHIR